MKYLAPLHDLAEEKVVPLQPLANLFPGANYEIDKEGWIQLSYHLPSLMDAIPLERHDHEQIDVRVLSWLAISVGTKENNLLRLILLDNSSGKLSYRALAYHDYRIPSAVTCPTS